MPLTFRTVNGNNTNASYSLLLPTTASIGTVTGSSVQITGITGPPNFTFSVIRNGTIIATGQTGSTYTDSTVAQSTTYVYQIVPANSFATGLPVRIGTVITPISMMSSFTTINAGSTVNSCTITGGFGSQISCIAVNRLRTKMLFANISTNIYYCTSSDGITWTTPQAVAVPNGGTSFTVGLSQDGTMGVCGGQQTGPCAISWTGATPVITQIGSTINYNLVTVTITPDGQTIVSTGDGTTPYVGKWNGTTYVMTQLVNANWVHHSIGISPSGNVIFYITGYYNYLGVSGQSLNYVTINWNGTTVTSYNAYRSTSITVSDLGLCVVGGGGIGEPTNIVYTDGASMYYASWNSTTKAIGTQTTLISSGCNNVWNMQPTGNGGNIIYYPASGNGLINYLTLSVS